jgi:hypothetical protein
LRGFRWLSLQHSPPCVITSNPQPDLQITPIEKIRLPLKSRDELPPILAGLQWLWMHPTLKAEILALLEANILVGKQVPGAPGRTCGKSWCWASSASAWMPASRVERVANHDTLVRQMLSVPARPWGGSAKVFGSSNAAGLKFTPRSCQSIFLMACVNKLFEGGTTFLRRVHSILLEWNKWRVSLDQLRGLLKFQGFVFKRALEESGNMGTEVLSVKHCPNQKPSSD